MEHMAEFVERDTDEQMMRQVLDRFEDDVLVRQEINLWLTDLLDDRAMLKAYADDPPVDCACTCEACMECEGIPDDDFEDDFDDYTEDKDEFCDVGI